MNYDVIICGGGPAGAACATFCASGGLKTLVIEKNIFPREKVCGDSINPNCWPVLERLGVADRVLSLAHSKLSVLEFIGIDGRSIEFPLHASDRGEIAVKRSLFDELLLQRAMECGADVLQDTTVTSVEQGWKVRAGGKVFASTHLIAADGRNSTVMRLLGMLPAPVRERVAIQTHIPLPAGFGERVVLRFFPWGYCGYNSIGNGQLNLCLVAKADEISNLKRWSESHFKISPLQSWRTITPLARKAIPASGKNFLAIGDAARVVEPFTGEGTYYAIVSGELAAKHLCQKTDLESYRREHKKLYSGRLWVNRISKYAALNPRIATFALDAMRHYPKALRFLTAKVVGNAVVSGN